MRERQLSAEYTRVCVRAAPLGAVLALIPTMVRADIGDRLAVLEDPRGSHDAFVLATFVGLVLFAATVALLHLAGRRRAAQRENALAGALNEVRAKLDRAETFLAVEPQITIAWGLRSNEPDIEGDASLVSDAPILRRVLGFGSWLPPNQAQDLETRVTRLRERGEAFRLAVVSLNGRHLETEGRAVSGRAVMRIRDVSGDRLEASRLREAQARASADLESLRGLLDAVRYPAWARDTYGKLIWVNTAYVRAVEASDANDTLRRGIELLESPAREASAAKRAQMEVFRGRAAAVVAGMAQQPRRRRGAARRHLGRHRLRRVGTRGPRARTCNRRRRRMRGPSTS